jgi:hypothetical protein
MPRPSPGLTGWGRQAGALFALLDRLGYDGAGNHAEGRRLVFVGDLVDRCASAPPDAQRLGRCGAARDQAPRRGAARGAVSDGVHLLFVRRGPDSVRVVDFVRTLHEAGRAQARPLRCSIRPSSLPAAARARRPAG